MGCTRQDSHLSVQGQRSTVREQILHEVMHAPAQEAPHLQRIPAVNKLQGRALYQIIVGRLHHEIPTIIVVET